MDSPAKDFELVEASINDLHAAVKTGSVTVTQVVESYIARAKAFNGVSSMLVTADGAGVHATGVAGGTRTHLSDRDDKSRCSPGPQQIQRAIP